MDDLKSLATEQLQALNLKLKSDISARNTLQEAIKVTLNSLYGASGNRFFRFYDIRIAEGITRTGRLVILWLERACNNWIDRIVGESKDRCLAIDTDSLYLCLEDLRIKIVKGKELPDDKTTDLIDAICKKIQEEAIKPALQELCQILKCPDPAIDMKREAIASGGFWTAAKKYALDVIDMEGVRLAEPDMKVTGLDAVRYSATTEFCRDALEEAFKIILREKGEDRVYKFIEKTRVEYMKLPLLEMAKPGGISDLASYMDGKGGWVKGTHINARCAIVYNTAIGPGSGLEGRYQPIKPGDKVRFLQLKMPNPFKSDAIAVPYMIPPEFDMERWADKQGMFENDIIRPLTLVCDRINISSKDIPAISGFMDW